MGATLIFDGSVPANDVVQFSGSSGTLVLAQPSAFDGIISGITPGDANQVLDLGGFSSQSGDSFTVTPTFSSGDETSLLVTDTTRGTSETVSLIGDETASNGFSWTATADGNGGADVVDPATTPVVVAIDPPIVVADGASVHIATHPAKP